jgi:hypothetical protein
MALTYEESATLMLDGNFQGRIKVACLTFANYIQNESPATQGHTARLRWAQSAFQNSQAAAQQIQPTTVMDPAVQAAGSVISDTDLQAAVEDTVQKFL